MKRWIGLFFIAISLFCMQCAVAGQAAQKLESLLGKVTSLTGNFTQSTQNSSHEVIATANGSFKMKRPGRFYWSVVEPYKQLIVINYKKLWLYDEGLAQVTVKRLTKTHQALNPASLLTGRVKEMVARNTVTLLREAGGVTIRLVPKNKKNPFKYMEIFFDGGKIQGLHFQNQMGEFTYISFEDVIQNKPMTSAIFNFKIPKGVDVVEG